MSKATEDPRRLSRLSPDEDPCHVAALFQSAKAAPEEELPRLHWRLRASLRFRATHARRLVRMALVASGLLFTGGMVGAVVKPFWEHKVGPAPTAEPATEVTRRSAGKRTPRGPAEACASEPVPVPIAATPAEDEPQASPVVRDPAPARLLRRASAPHAIPDPLPVPEAPAAPAPPVDHAIPDPLPAPEAPAASAPPSPTTVEQALLSDILRSLRAQHNPQMALALLDEHAERFPETALGPEAAMFRAEALLGLGRRAEALRVLDALPLASMPNRDAQVVLRGELRAAAGRWQEARADFDRSLSTPVSGIDTKSTDIMERALWGRSSARSRLGDEDGARADLSSYLRRFPSGRFATQAAALLRDSP